jgi:hypothetical protein
VIRDKIQFAILTSIAVFLTNIIISALELVSRFDPKLTHSYLRAESSHLGTVYQIVLAVMLRSVDGCQNVLSIAIVKGIFEEVSRLNIDISIHSQNCG